MNTLYNGTAPCAALSEADFRMGEHLVTELQTLVFKMGRQIHSAHRTLQDRHPTPHSLGPSKG